MLKYIIFDFDGTLADSKDVFISVYNQIATSNNYRQIDSDNFKYLQTLTISERCRYLKVPVYRIPFLATEFLTNYRRALKKIRLFGGIKELLTALNDQGFDIAIISSNAERNISEILSDNQIDYICKIYCSTKLFGKATLIKGFVRKYALQPEEVLYIGDEVRDILACKKAGVKIVWVGWGYDSFETAAIAKPDYVVSDPSEVLFIAQEMIP